MVFFIFLHLQDDLLQNQFFREQQRDEKPKNKNCKLHIGNLPLNIAEETVRRVFQKYGPIRDVKIIRKNSQGQPLKDYCYGFVLMEEGEGAMNAVTELRANSPLGTTWTVSFSKDKNDQETLGIKKDEKKPPCVPDRTSKKRDEPKTKKKSNKKKKKSESSSSSSSRSRSAKKIKKQKKRKPSSSESSDSKIPTRSVLQKPDSSNLMDLIFTDPQHLQSQLNVAPKEHYQIKQQIFVRELFISGIPLNKQSQDIQRVFSQYGVIERVDITPKQLVNYAYVKYKRLESVITAQQNTPLIADMLESNGQIKIYPSDPFRRVQIVGNQEDVEKDEEMIPIMFIGYPQNQGQHIDERLLHKYAEKYGGPVKGIQNVLPESPQLRSYILIEFEDLRDCKKARRRFCRHKIQILGDKKCDVAILSQLPHGVNKRPVQPFGMNAHQPFNPQFNSFQHQNMQQQQQQQQQMMFGQQQQPQQPMMQQYGQMIPPPMMYQNQGLPQYLSGLAPPTHPAMQMPSMPQMPQISQNQMPQQNQQFFYKPPQDQMNQMRPPQQVFQAQDFMNYLQPPKFDMQQAPPQQPQMNSNFDFSFLAPKSPQPLEPEESVNFFWSGYMNRGKQHRVGVDARILRASIDTSRVDLPHNLDMGFKTTFQEAVSRASTPCIVFILTPMNAMEQPKFMEYINYLRSKDRAGVIQADTFTIYVIPPGPEGEHIYSLRTEEIMAIYCNK